MQWDEKHINLQQYEYASSNQHGDRFKRSRFKRVSVAHLSCERNDAAGMVNLILLSHTLNTPVRYDFKEQTPYIEVVSKRALNKIN